jgi:hypothetical protein
MLPAAAGLAAVETREVRYALSPATQKKKKVEFHSVECPSLAISPAKFRHLSLKFGRHLNRFFVYIEVNSHHYILTYLPAEL